ncbi:hypothetical protein [Streptomyces sp. NPDC058066]|uniref:hypothetical protein n=1 Tax=Streptomyces sp. NPDC058066 TaxID=3346323 RepID=UPI0036EB81C3
MVTSRGGGESAQAGTFSDDDLASYAGAYTGRERLRGGFEHYRTLLDDGRENRALLAQRKLSMPVLAIGSTHSGTATAQALAPHADHVQGAAARPDTSSPRKTPTGSPRR